MSLSNMQLDDALAILGRVGTVTLRKGTNDRSATPGYRADTAGWYCELTIAGYLRPYQHGHGGSQLRIGGRFDKQRGRTPSEAARDCLTDLEQWLESDDAAQCRACYVKDWENQVRRAGPRPADVPIYQWDRNARHPGPLVPEARIEWGDA